MEFVIIKSKIISGILQIVNGGLYVSSTGLGPKK